MVEVNLDILGNITDKHLDLIHSSTNNIISNILLIVLVYIKATAIDRVIDHSSFLLIKFLLYFLSFTIITTAAVATLPPNIVSIAVAIVYSHILDTILHSNTTDNMGRSSSLVDTVSNLLNMSSN